MVTIVLAEDHQIVREGLRALIEKDPHLSVVGETNDGQQAVQLAEELRPNVLILDLSLPGLHGIKVAWQVRQRVPETKVVILSMHVQKAYILAAFENGASAYITKDDTEASLLQAIHCVMEDKKFISSVLPFDLEDVSEQLAREHVDECLAVLTPREKEILQLIAEGRTSPQIADRLSISPRTVDTHRRNVMAKLGLDNVNHLVRYAIEHGLIPRRGGSD